MTKPEDATVPAVGSQVERGVGRLEPERRADGMPTSADERYLRRLLARRVAMPAAYYDDGEAQGQEHGVVIDFMREPVADIDAKLRALNVARLECWKPRATGCWCARCDMEHNVTRTRMSVCDKCGDKRCPRAEDNRNECRETPNVGNEAKTTARTEVLRNA
jgi:hypothetical protein